MEVVLGKTAGFCFGVKNAVKRAEEEVNRYKNIYCLGELVHNKQVTKNLSDKGVKFISNIKEAKDKVIIRSHGVERSVYEYFNKNNIKVIDLTCPKVLKIHNIAEEYARKDYYIFLIGKKEHPEVKGTVSFCGRNLQIIENLDDIDKINLYNKSQKNKLLIIAQTTYSIEKFNIIQEEITKKAKKSSDILVINTICNATKLRQEETEKISKEVDAMIIVGDKASSNTNKLYEIAKKTCKKSIFVEKKEDLLKSNIEKYKKVGIMAGASTPAKTIEEVIDIVKKI